jgi:diadenosine tetraphosphatase ApaH/serine/threonine PP2A family protein phosphatase
MRYAILGDIHGNWPALNVALDDALQQGVTKFASVGDLVGYNPDPVRCVNMVRDMGFVCVKGNHDHFCAHAFGPNDLSPLAAAGILWTRNQLDARQLQYLDALQRTVTMDGFTLVHDTLDRQEEWQYVACIEDAARSLGCQETPVCFNGHTHVPVMFEMREQVTIRFFRRDELDMKHVTLTSSETVPLDPCARYFVNVGSVGQPRDRDPRAAYVIYDSDRFELVMRRLPYDVEATRRRIASAKLPPWLGARLGVGM